MSVRDVLKKPRWEEFVTPISVESGHLAKLWQVYEDRKRFAFAMRRFERLHGIGRKIKIHSTIPVC